MSTIDTLPIDMGKELSFDNHSYSLAIEFAETKIVPAIKSVITAYNELSLSRPFDQSLFAELTIHGTLKVKEELTRLTESDTVTKKSPIAIKAAFATIETYLEPLQEALDTLIPLFNYRSNLPGIYPYRFTTDDFIIAGEKVTVNKDRLKAFYSTFIKSEDQLNMLYNLRELVTAYNRASNYLKERNIRQNLVYGLLGSFVRFNKDKELEIIPEALNKIK